MLLDISHLYFSYHPETPLFRNLNLKIEPGKIIALAGESGCGKSTLLHLIYGLLDWQQGTIELEGKNLLGPKGNIVPGESNIKMVAQNYDLLPFATVAENVGKYISNVKLQEKKDKVYELLEAVGMEEFAGVLPKNLSGGQQQRVAIARALSVTPKLLLLDEPFSNLNFSRKIELRGRLFKYVKKENFSLIISTHDLPEIMMWLDQIIVLQNGRLIQNDTAEETYKNPYNDYVAKLFGEVNIFSEQEQKKLNLQKKFYYPHQLEISENGVEADVLESRFAGNYFWNEISLDGKKLIFYTPHQIEDRIKIVFKELV